MALPEAGATSGAGGFVKKYSDVLVAVGIVTIVVMMGKQINPMPRHYRWQPLLL